MDDKLPEKVGLIDVNNLLKKLPNSDEVYDETFGMLGRVRHKHRRKFLLDFLDESTKTGEGFGGAG